jgi:hypothetical protein
MVLPSHVPMPAFVDYEDMRASADRFLYRHGWRGEVPVNIERIVDVKMGIDIVREPGLTSRIDVEGFLSGTGRRSTSMITRRTF